MPVSCRSRATAVVALAVLLPGCVTGHVMAAARRREYAREIQSVTRDGAGTVVRYRAEVTDDGGGSRGMVERSVRLARDGGEPTLRQLTGIRTEPWVYPLLPLALASDVVVVPILLLVWPGLLLLGD